MAFFAWTSVFYASMMIVDGKAKRDFTAESIEEHREKQFEGSGARVRD